MKIYPSASAGVDCFPATMYKAGVYEKQFKYVGSTTWATDIESLETVDIPYEPVSVLLDKGGSKEEQWTFDINGAAVFVNISWGNCYVYVASNDIEDIDPIIAEIKEWVPNQAEEEGKVPMNFWSYDPGNGASRINRKIDVPSWSEIKDNYTSSLQIELEEMMQDFKPSHGGQLLIWHGVPGTGKTYALRALTNEWREWAKFHYISDPEEFFGRAAYMHQVLLQDAEKWNLLILEDTGEILMQDAKETTGQALSRLLNIVDGMIGQGLKILVLITTNEKIEEMNEAVIRPGRCAAKIEFSPMEEAEIQEWLKSRKLTTDTDPETLAELFSIEKNFRKGEKKLAKTIGFA